MHDNTKGVFPEDLYDFKLAESEIELILYIRAFHKSLPSQKDVDLGIKTNPWEGRTYRGLKDKNAYDPYLRTPGMYKGISRYGEYMDIVKKRNENE